MSAAGGFRSQVASQQLAGDFRQIPKPHQNFRRVAAAAIFVGHASKSDTAGIVCLLDGMMAV
jgi:hypothetical protein